MKVYSSLEELQRDYKQERKKIEREINQAETLFSVKSILSVLSKKNTAETNGLLISFIDSYKSLLASSLILKNMKGQMINGPLSLYSTSVKVRDNIDHFSSSASECLDQIFENYAEQSYLFVPDSLKSNARILGRNISKNIEHSEGRIYYLAGETPKAVICLYNLKDSSGFKYAKYNITLARKSGVIYSHGPAWPSILDTPSERRRSWKEVMLALKTDLKKIGVYK